MTPMFDDDAVDSFFSDADYNDLDVQEGGYDRFRLQAGEHKVVVTEDRKLQKKDGSWTYIIKFVNDKEQDFTQYLDPIVAGDETNFYGEGNNQRSVRDIKRQTRMNVLGALGVPKTSIPKLQPGDLTGIEGTLKLYKKGDYIKFGSFKVTKGGSVGSPLKKAEANPLEGIKEFAAANQGGDDFGL
jgi:hypothetical protein